jgi:hypothetical protein
MSKTHFTQGDVTRAIKSAKAAGVNVETVEVVTPDGVTIRISGKREVCNANPWDVEVERLSKK